MSDFKLLGVAGNPILHSLSPAIWQNAIDALGIEASYLKIPANSAREVIDIFKRCGLQGMSVTAPFKKAIIPFLDELDERAAFLESVNTVVSKRGKLYGYNTDVDGVKNSIQPYCKTGMKALITGTGGAAPAAMQALRELGLSFSVYGRNQKKRKELAEKFQCAEFDIANVNQDLKNFDIVVSTLPAGADVIDPGSLKKEHIVLDANYKHSVLGEYAKRVGATFISGKTWLAHQAIPAFKMVTDKVAGFDTLYGGFNNTYRFPEIITLTGFMGSGKTTVGRTLASNIGYEFVDIDEKIEQQERMTIPEIFETKGEACFRKMESVLLHEIIQKKKLVIACGGGIISDENNRMILQEKTLCFWLDASVEYCLDTLDISNRPLLQVDNPLVKAKELYESRVEDYALSAHVLMNVEGKTTNEISNKIYEEISECFNI